MRFHLLLTFLLFPGVATAVGIVPPIPRVERADSPSEGPESGDDPLKTIERITLNARAIGDRLQDEDAGSETQKAQEQLLKDIESLLKPPPPMNQSGGGGGGQGGGNGNSGDMNPKGEGGGSGGGTNNQNDGGGSNSRRPRGSQPQHQGGGQKPEPMGGGTQQGQPMGGGGVSEPMPMGAGGGNDPMPMGGQPGGGGRSAPDLPLEDPFTRRVWGHLPEKVRQQAMQSYREQFMPRYSDLLKQYYSTLNEKQNPIPSK